MKLGENIGSRTQEIARADPFLKWIDLKRITDNALDDSIVAGLTQLVFKENIDGFEDLQRFFRKYDVNQKIYLSTMNSVDILIEDDDLIQAALVQKEFFQILQPSSDEDNGNGTNDFGESFDFDGNYTLNGTFDDHLGIDMQNTTA